VAAVFRIARNLVITERGQRDPGGSRAGKVEREKQRVPNPLARFERLTGAQLCLPRAARRSRRSAYTPARRSDRGPASLKRKSQTPQLKMEMITWKVLTGHRYESHSKARGYDCYA
jgi:hypothetical protein